MHFQIFTDKLKTFIKVWDEMRNGCFFHKSTNSAWEMAWPLLSTRLQDAVTAVCCSGAAVQCNDQAARVGHGNTEEHLKYQD